MQNCWILQCSFIALNNIFMVYVVNENETQNLHYLYNKLNKKLNQH